MIEFFQYRKLRNIKMDCLGGGTDLYDESRWTKTLVDPDSREVLKRIKKDDWSKLRAQTDNHRIRLNVNSYQTIGFTEEALGIPNRDRLVFRFIAVTRQKWPFNIFNMKNLNKKPN